MICMKYFTFRYFQKSIWNHNFQIFLQTNFITVIMGINEATHGNRMKNFEDALQFFNLMHIFEFNFEIKMKFYPKLMTFYLFPFFWTYYDVYTQLLWIWFRYVCWLFIDLFIILVFVLFLTTFLSTLWLFIVWFHLYVWFFFNSMIPYRLMMLLINTTVNIFLWWIKIRSCEVKLFFSFSTTPYSLPFNSNTIFHRHLYLVWQNPHFRL